MRKGGSTAAVDLFRFSVPINARGIEIVDAEFVGAQRDGFGILEVNKGKRPPAWPMIVRLSPVLPKTFRYVSRFDLLGPGAPGQSAKPGYC